jgi:hypothetical protein
MKYSLLFSLAIFCSLSIFGQTFEGEIVYQNSFKSKLKNLTDQQFSSMLGTRQEYYIKNGDYKSITNGTVSLWQLYINADNKLYNKMSNSETILWNDGSVNDDEVLSSTLNKAVSDVLGYKCDELILNCKSGIQKYYFNSKLSVDTKLYANHKYGNWYDYLSKTNALPLKMIVDNAQFSMESVAVEIKPMVLDAKLFQLPADAKTAKSPY